MDGHFYSFWRHMVGSLEFFSSLIEILVFLKENHFLPQTFSDLKQSMGSDWSLSRQKIRLPISGPSGQFYHHAAEWRERCWKAEWKGVVSAGRISITKDVYIQRALGKVKNILIEHRNFKSTQESHVVIIRTFLTSQNQISKCIYEAHKHTHSHI